MYLWTLHPPSRRATHITNIARDTCRGLTTNAIKINRPDVDDFEDGIYNRRNLDRAVLRKLRSRFFVAVERGERERKRPDRTAGCTNTTTRVCVSLALPDCDVVGPRCATRVSALTSRKRLTLAPVWRGARWGMRRGETIVHPSRSGSPLFLVHHPRHPRGERRTRLPRCYTTSHRARPLVHPSTPRPPTSRRGESGIKCRPEGW